MREWFWPLVPVIAVVYFVVYPHQLGDVINWAGIFLR